MNPISKPELARLHAQIALQQLRVCPATVGRIRELAQGGLEDFEIAWHTKVPIAAVRLIKRAGP